MEDSAGQNIDKAYPERITSFIDLLGFSRDVQQIENRPHLFISIDAVLRRIGKCKADIDRRRANGGMTFDARMNHFSDCLVLSYRNEPGASLRALWDAAFLGHVILRPGYLPRGVITLGRLYHDDVVVYGSALVEAAEREKCEVITPRIAVTDTVMKLVRADLERDGAEEIESDFIRDVGTGPFLHILGKKWSFLQKERELEEAGHFHGDGVREMFEELQAMLPLRYQNAPHEAARRKIEWMRDYINSVIDEDGHSGTLKCCLPDRQ